MLNAIRTVLLGYQPKCRPTVHPFPNAEVEPIAQTPPGGKMPQNLRQAARMASAFHWQFTCGWYAVAHFLFRLQNRENIWIHQGWHGFNTAALATLSFLFLPLLILGSSACKGFDGRRDACERRACREASFIAKHQGCFVWVLVGMGWDGCV